MKQKSLIRRRSLLAAPLLLGASSMLAQMPRPLLIAVPPFLSPSAALAAFRPLRQHLESQLKQPVELYTARDFRELVEQTRRGEHDVTLLPAHLAGLALSDWGFQALAATVEATPVLILLRQGSVIKTAAELRGKRMGMLGTLSLTTAVASLWLRQQQLEPGRDLTVARPMPSWCAACCASSARSSTCASPSMACRAWPWSSSGGHTWYL